MLFTQKYAKIARRMNFSVHMMGKQTMDFAIFFYFFIFSSLFDKRILRRIFGRFVSDIFKSLDILLLSICGRKVNRLGQCSKNISYFKRMARKVFYYICKHLKSYLLHRSANGVSY